MTGRTSDSAPNSVASQPSPASKLGLGPRGSSILRKVRFVFNNHHYNFCCIGIKVYLDVTRSSTIISGHELEIVLQLVGMNIVSECGSIMRALL